MRNIVGLIIGITFLFGPVASAQVVPVLDFFHGRECPHCHEEKKWFSTLKKAYPDIVINEYEVWHNQKNALLAETRLKELGKKFKGVPANIIGGEKVVSGFRPKEILAAFEEVYGSPAVEIIETAPNPSWFSRILSTILSWFGV